MKNYLLLALLFISTSIFAQEEWGDVDKNTLTMNELPPVWQGCEKGNATERGNCFNQKLAQHIGKNFKYPAEAYKKNEQGKVIVELVINEKGLPEVQKVSGGSKLLQDEAVRNIMLIPKMAKPGMMGGKPRAIKYTIPINFKTGK